MTDEEKQLIKLEIYRAYDRLPKHCNESTKFVIALKEGLERAQRILNENRK